jgi:hypothetical protein
MHQPIRMVERKKTEHSRVRLLKRGETELQLGKIVNFFPPRRNCAENDSGFHDHHTFIITHHDFSHPKKVYVFTHYSPET